MSPILNVGGWGRCGTARAAHVAWLRAARLLERAGRRLGRRELRLDGALFERDEARLGEYLERRAA